MEFILLAWLKMDFWYVDTYSNINECISKAEILFKEDRSKYMCLPKNGMYKQKLVKGVFYKDLLKEKK